VAILAGRSLPDLPFVGGSPSQGVLEAMELFAGGRRSELPGFSPFHLVRLRDSRLIGSIGFTPVPETRWVTVGYGVSSAVEGQGYTTEALIALIDWLFAAGVESVRADTYADHVASRRVMEKAGMDLIEETEGMEDGRPVRYVLYAIAHPPVGRR
jgi:RimJ/RimL family protein N-acetyltransferase